MTTHNVNPELFKRDTERNVYMVRSATSSWNVHLKSSTVSHVQQSIVDSLDMADLTALHRAFIKVGDKWFNDKTWALEVRLIRKVVGDDLSYELGLREIRSTGQLRAFVRTMLCAISRRYVDMIESVNSITGLEIQLALDSIGVKVSDVKTLISGTGKEAKLIIVMPNKVRYTVASNPHGKLWSRQNFEKFVLPLIKSDYNL